VISGTNAAELIRRYDEAREAYEIAVESGEGVARADDEMTTTAREVGAEAVELLRTMLEQEGAPAAEEPATWAYSEEDKVQRRARYTDGAYVQEGDLIRYRQAPGGVLPASPRWDYGVAARASWEDSGELYLRNDEGRLFHIFGHVVERA
jgi:hypothetical protein